MPGGPSSLDAAQQPVPSVPSSGGLTCQVCGVAAFATLDAQRSHFRLDWHRYNARRALRALAPLTEQQFDDLDDGLCAGRLERREREGGVI